MLRYDKFNAIVLKNGFFSDIEITKVIHESAWIVLPYLSVYSSGVLLRTIEQETPLIHSDLKSLNSITHNKSVSVLSKAGSASSLQQAMEHALNSDHLKFVKNTQRLKRLLIERNNIYNSSNFPKFLESIGLHSES